MGQPDAHRPFALGLGFLRCAVKLAGHALGEYLADEHVALRAGDPGGGGGLGADLLDDDVDAALAVVGLHRAVAGRVAGHADAERGRERVERAAPLLLGNGVLRRRRVGGIVALLHRAAGILRDPGARLVADDDRQRAGGRPGALRGEAAPGAIAAVIVHGDRAQHAFLEGPAFDIVVRAVEFGGEVDSEAGQAREGDLVGNVDLARVRGALGRCGRRRGHAQDDRCQGPTKTHETPFPGRAYVGSMGTIEARRSLRHPTWWPNKAFFVHVETRP